MSLKKRPTAFGGIFDIDSIEKRVSELEALMHTPTFWDDTGEAQRISKEKSLLEKKITGCKDAEQALEDLDVLIELSTEDGGQTLFSDIKEGIKTLRHKLEQLEIETLLSGDIEMTIAIVSI